MLSPGLVSVTFRKLTPEQIVALVAEAGLSDIEWGGDIHVPPGDAKKAEAVRALTAAAKLRVAAYGSYFRVGEAPVADFAGVLASAVILEAPVIRVWAGKEGSAAADAAYRAKVVSEMRQLADQAAGRGIRVAFEFHSHTLTDTNESAVALYREIAHPNVRSYWQPPPSMGVDECVVGLRCVLPLLSNIHCYSWGPGGVRQPLAVGEAGWKRYLQMAASNGRDHAVLLEFVRDDAPEAFKEDAAVLRKWCSEACPG